MSVMKDGIHSVGHADYTFYKSDLVRSIRHLRNSIKIDLQNLSSEHSHGEDQLTHAPNVPASYCRLAFI